MGSTETETDEHILRLLGPCVPPRAPSTRLHRARHAALPGRGHLGVPGRPLPGWTRNARVGRVGNESPACGQSLAYSTGVRCLHRAHWVWTFRGAHGVWKFCGAHWVWTFRGAHWVWTFRGAHWVWTFRGAHWVWTNRRNIPNGTAAGVRPCAERGRTESSRRGNPQTTAGKLSAKHRPKADAAAVDVTGGTRPTADRKEDGGNPHPPGRHRRHERQCTQPTPQDFPPQETRAFMYRENLAVAGPLFHPRRTRPRASMGPDTRRCQAGGTWEFQGAPCTRGHRLWQQPLTNRS